MSPDPTPAASIHLGDDGGLPLHGMPTGPAMPDTTVSVVLGYSPSGQPVAFATSSAELLDHLREAIDAAATMLVPAAAQ